MKTTVFRVLLLLLAIPPVCLAHQLDEYIQATLVVIDPGEIRLKINLTPGVQVASQVLAEIDRNHDNVIATNEAATYGEKLRHDLTVQLDGLPAKLALVNFNYPEVSALRSGVGIIQIEFLITPGSLIPGPHKFTLQNQHLPSISSYLFNAARPTSDVIQVMTQKRNNTQSFGEIDFNLNAPKHSTSSKPPRS